MKSLTPEAMEARVARYNKLQTYQRQNFEAHGIPAGAVEKITARRVYPVMAPADYQGRSAGAPVKGPRGLIISIAECEPGNGPGLHRHLNTVENFLCLSGRFEIVSRRTQARARAARHDFRQAFRDARLQKECVMPFCCPVWAIIHLR